jgi:hypothetical protein
MIGDFDVSHADNVHPDKVSQNIIIHYDAGNHATVVDISDPNRKSIDEHEHKIYEKLFSDSLSKQHTRNEAARHPKRNKRYSRDCKKPLKNIATSTMAIFFIAIIFYNLSSYIY